MSGAILTKISGIERVAATRFSCLQRFQQRKPLVALRHNRIRRLSLMWCYTKTKSTMGVFLGLVLRCPLLVLVARPGFTAKERFILTGSRQLADSRDGFA